MSGLLRVYFELFVNKSGIAGELNHYLTYGKICAMLLGLTACMFGFRVYRLYFSAIIFMGATIAFCTFLSHMPWAQVVAWIAVAGTIIAFLGFRWYRFAGFCICALVGALAGWLIVPSYLVAVLSGALTGVAELFFPVIMIVAVTSLWGAWIFAEGLNVSPMLSVSVSVIAVIIGFMVQMRMNKTQKLFSRPLPDKVRYWLENRRR